ncbi:MAG: Ig-like domain-containing protein, partial [Acidobacteriales bacterium]|nr:Ig-like domain-containing protein [Terriglobales bacterium]
PANGTTAWSATIALADGVNRIEAQSFDAAGNESALATRFVTNVVVSPFTLTISGSGTVTPNLNGQMLEVGRSYTITAQPASGYSFNSWSGGLSGSNPQLTFIMQPGLSLIATFSDSSIPTIAISSPASNLRVTNNSIAVSGTASDNVSVSQVLCRVNGGSFQQASGTTTWSTTLALAAGVNRIEAQSFDADGNGSILATRFVTNVVVSQFTLAISGSGTVTPNLNGQMLEVGRSYTISAQPSSGHTFAGWSGSLSGSNPQLTFVMQPGLSLTATFSDTSRPTIAITSPASDLRITNDLITISGTASDNVGVSQVFYRVGNEPFQLASGTTTWSATIELTEGVNRIEAQCYDTDGNGSTVATRFVTNAVVSPFSLTISGSGTVTPNLNGQMLEVGRSYTITAQPASGYSFSSWSGSLSGSNPQLTFVMQAGLSLTASFSDSTRPTITVTSPANNSVVTNSSVILYGTASDDAGIQRVLCQLNGGAFENATGTTSWSAPALLVPGTNTIILKSVDLAGNESAPITHKLIYAVRAPISIMTSGNGTILPDLDGQWLEIGRTYTVTAQPAAGFAFSSWSGIPSTSAQLTFVMEEDLQIVANFVDSAKPTVAVTSPANNSTATNANITLMG